jgi:hypothetical protein
MMKTVTEIEDAIKQLPSPQVEELVAWIEAFRARRAAPRARLAGPRLVHPEQAENFVLSVEEIRDADV